MASPWALLANATLIFRKPLSMVVDPETGNEVPSGYQNHSVRAYFKSAKLGGSGANSAMPSELQPIGGVPVGSYQVEGYTVGVLPSWASLPINPAVECVVDNLGSGTFYFQGQIHVVKQLVEQAGQGTRIQGYFTLQGGT